MNNCDNYSQAFEDFEYPQIFSLNQDEYTERNILLFGNDEYNSLDYTAPRLNEVCQSEPRIVPIDSVPKSDHFKIIKGRSQENFSLVIVDDFNLLITNEMFGESKVLLDQFLTRESKEYRIFSLSLLRFQLFCATQVGDSEKVAAVTLKIKNYDDDFTINNGYIDCLIKNPRIFQTSFFSQKKSKIYFPAIKELALILLRAEGLLPDFEFPTSLCEDSIILILENIEEEMIYYMISYQRIYESTGDFNEIYLNFNSSFNRNDPSISKMINDYFLISDSSNYAKTQVTSANPKKKFLCMVRKENPEVINSSTKLKKKSGCITNGSDETSDRSKEIINLDISEEEINLHVFSGVDKQSINRKILKHFKQFIKMSAKSSSNGNEYPEYVSDFINNNLNPPLKSNGIKMKWFCYEYMHWLFFAHQQLVVFYQEFIAQCFSYVFNKVVKACNILESDTLFLKVYITKLVSLYQNDQPQFNRANKKLKKVVNISKRVDQQTIFKIERVPKDVKNTRESIMHEDIDNNYEDTRITDNIYNLLSDVYHEVVFK